MHFRHHNVLLKFPLLEDVFYLSFGNYKNSQKQINDHLNKDRDLNFQNDIPVLFVTHPLMVAYNPTSLHNIPQGI